MGIGTPLPPAFPVKSYNKILSTNGRWLKATGQGDKPPVLNFEFAGAWNAVGYRSLACFEHSEAFTTGIQKSHQSHRNLYEQDRDLFGFFLNGFSVFESAYYGIFCLAAMVRSGVFPIETDKDQRNVKFAAPGVALLRKEFPDHEVAQILDDLLDSRDYKDWREVRNVLVHRSAPPKIWSVYLGAPKSGTQDVFRELQSRQPKLGLLDRTTTRLRWKWLSVQLRELLEAAARSSVRLIP